MKLVNFNDLKQMKKSYGGSNANKISLLIDNEFYMVKLPSHSYINDNLSYSNSCISEYLGSHIFNMLGIKAQETILGVYKYKDKERISVACKDFEDKDFKLMDFASVKNQIIDSRTNGYGTNLEDIIDTINKQTIIDPVLLQNHFWDMFVIDAFISNWDRHNGNWGFLYNQSTDEVKLAPIYDCGSCLNPQADESIFIESLKDKKEMIIRVIDFPTSAIYKNNKRINYFKFIKSHEYKECDDAIKRIKSKINLVEINKLIDDIDCISFNHKEFLKQSLLLKYEVLFETKDI